MEDTVHPFEGAVQGLFIPDISLDELGPRGQFPLRSAEVEQDNGSTTLGQAGPQAKAQVASSSRHQNFLPRGQGGLGLSLLLWRWCWGCRCLTGLGPSSRPPSGPSS